MIRLFNRFELKYLMPVSKAWDIIKDLEGQTEPDAHAGPDGYRIGSLYYDSPDYDFFWDKIEGLRFRRKIRIRVYPRDGRYEDVTVAMVEIKQRTNKTVQKRRLQLPLQEAFDLCAGELARTDLDRTDEAVASEVQYLVQAMHLRPSCLIEYHRRAFVGTRYNPGLRITFDTELKCRVKDLQLEHTAVNRYFLPPDWCIMEVKVDEAVPDWVSSLLIRHNCELHRVSKYCAGLALAKKIQVTHLALSPHPALDSARQLQLSQSFPKVTAELPPEPPPNLPPETPRRLNLELKPNDG